MRKKFAVSKSNGKRRITMSDRVVNKLTDNKFLNIYEVVDPEHHCKGYQFAERRGKDSVAFICYNKEDKNFIINCEFTPPNGMFMERAFGGSLDKEDKKHVDIVIEEVEEEAGYKVDKEDVKYVGNCFVSTQMNQRCYLYLVFVSDEQKVERKPQNAIEALASIRKCHLNWILSGDDWKAITIVMKAVERGYLKLFSKEIEVGI